MNVSALLNSDIYEDQVRVDASLTHNRLGCGSCHDDVESSALRGLIVGIALILRGDEVSADDEIIYLCLAGTIR